MPVKKRGLPEQKRMRHDSHFVEDLLTRDTSLVIQEIPLDRIRPNPDQPRKDLGDLEGIAGSIREHGVLEPILVKSVNQHFTIVSGERRYHACRLNESRSIPCIVKDLEENRVLEVALVENLQRKDLHPFEEADGLRALLNNFSYTHDEIAKKIGKSRTSVTEMLTLANLSSDVRTAAFEADISAKSMLLSVARLPTVDEQLALIERIAKGAPRAEVRRQGKKQNRAKPFVFKYRDPGKTFSFDLKFKKSEVAPDELVRVLETILDELKTTTA